MRHLAFWCKERLAAERAAHDALFQEHTAPETDHDRNSGTEDGARSTEEGTLVLVVLSLCILRIPCELPVRREAEKQEDPGPAVQEHRRSEPHPNVFLSKCPASRVRVEKRPRSLS